MEGTWVVIRQPDYINRLLVMAAPRVQRFGCGARSSALVCELPSTSIRHHCRGSCGCMCTCDCARVLMPVLTLCRCRHRFLSTTPRCVGVYVRMRGKDMSPPGTRTCDATVECAIRAGSLSHYTYRMGDSLYKLGGSPSDRIPLKLPIVHGLRKLLVDRMWMLLAHPLHHVQVTITHAPEQCHPPGARRRKRHLSHSQRSVQPQREPPL